MKKKQGVLVLILTVVLIGLLAFTTAVGFGPTGTGSAKNIKTGLDLAGGVSITYQAKGDDPSQEDMDDTVYKLQKRVEDYSEEAQVYQEGDDRRFWKILVNRDLWNSRMKAAMWFSTEAISPVQKAVSQRIHRPEPNSILWN